MQKIFVVIGVVAAVKVNPQRVMMQLLVLDVPRRFPMHAGRKGDYNLHGSFTAVCMPITEI